MIGLYPIVSSSQTYDSNLTGIRSNCDVDNKTTQVLQLMVA